MKQKRRLKFKSAQTQTLMIQGMETPTKMMMTTKSVRLRRKNGWKMMIATQMIVTLKPVGKSHGSMMSNGSNISLVINEEI
jgi:hypothetical protein